MLINHSILLSRPTVGQSAFILIGINCRKEKVTMMITKVMVVIKGRVIVQLSYFSKALLLCRTYVTMSSTESSSYNHLFQIFGTVTGLTKKIFKNTNYGTTEQRTRLEKAF